MGPFETNTGSPRTDGAAGDPSSAAGLPATAAAALSEQLGHPEWGDVVVLNVEDHAPARFLRTRTLQKAGYVVIEAASAAEALACLGTESPIRLVLLDVGLPDGYGFEVCAALKSKDPTLHVVLITSIYRSSTAKQQGRELGADEYLLEPVSGPRLVRTLHRLLAASTSRTTGVVTIDRFGRILGINGAAADLLNLTERGGFGRPFAHYIGSERHRFIESVRIAARGQIVQDDWLLQPRERKPFRVEIEMDTIDDGSEALECRIRVV
jgi:DNA-binding response OmpR family regulator